MPKESQLITDPEVLAGLIDGYNESGDGRQTAIDYVVNKYGAEKTEEWKQRGKANTVRSSTFGTCERRAVYSVLEGGETPVDHEQFVRERMYLGLQGENIFREFLVDLPGILHEEQNSFPIHVKSPKSNKTMEFVGTTDFVLEVEHGDGKYYIPIELKNTGYMQKWKEFSGHRYHKEQLLTWIYIGKELELNVPYGMLVYVHDLFNWGRLHDIKVVTITVDTSFKKIGRLTEDFNIWKPYIEQKRNSVIEGVKKKVLPDVPPHLPKYICKSCPFQEKCDRDEL